LDGGSWKFLKGDKLVAQTLGPKSRVDVGWFIGDAKELTLHVELESLKKDQIVISGKDAEKLVDRFRKRLGE
jgi:hypothetical protein